MNAIRIGNWNINGLAPKKHEVESLIKMHKLDIVLFSEAHCTEKSRVKIDGYAFYTTCHPDGTAHAGTAILIKKKHKASHNARGTDRRNPGYNNHS